MSSFEGLDLFCGSGGCTWGYVQGFASRGHRLVMTGVDNRNRPRYWNGGGDYFIRGNAIELLCNETFINSFDFIHLSPPCQHFSNTRTMNLNSLWRHDDLLTPSLKIIRELYPNKLIVIENVPEAPMYTRIHQILRLCASSFPGHSGFDERRLLHRHRHFRLHNFVVPKVNCQHNGYKPKGVYGSLNSDVPGGGEIAANLAEAKKLMQIDWMIWDELKEAVPPAYTEYISAAPGGLVDMLEAVPTCQVLPARQSH